jgi:hypothetical protein
MHLNGTEVDCAVCKTDLWLSAVVSSAAPGEAACPEHAAELPGAPADKVTKRLGSTAEFASGGEHGGCVSIEAFVKWGAFRSAGATCAAAVGCHSQ